MLIGLCGWIGSGKGTVGDILVYEYSFNQDSFAASLKDAVAVIFGWDRVLLEGGNAESRKWREEVDEFWSKRLKKTITPRLVLQWMGTEAGREVFGEDLWVTSVESRLIKNQSRNNVITDVRFPNEVEMIHRLGGVCVHVKRGPDPDFVAALCYEPLNEMSEMRKLFMASHYPEVHISEWAWVGHPLIKYQIQNEGTLEQLYTKVEVLLGLLKGEDSEAEQEHD